MQKFSFEYFYIQEDQIKGKKKNTMLNDHGEILGFDAGQLIAFKNKTLAFYCFLVWKTKCNFVYKM